MKRNNISGLEKNRPIHFKIGLICSLAFAIFAFNFTTTPVDKSLVFEGKTDLEDKEIEVIRTQHKKRLPPPTLEVTERIEAVEEVTVFEEIEPEPLSLDIDDETELIFDEGVDFGKDDEIEPVVDEAPLDILIEEAPRDFAEYMPSFGECDASELDKAEYKMCSDQALLNYFAQQINYPARARENQIEGRVILKFVIDENGEVTAPQVVRGVAGGCSEEALRVLKSMPKWKAGRHGGRNVKVNFTLPVKFALK